VGLAFRQRDQDVHAAFAKQTNVPGWLVLCVVTILPTMNKRQALAFVAVLENAVRELRNVIEREWRDEAPPPPTPPPKPNSPEKAFPDQELFLRLPQILERLPIAASTWWRWVQIGHAPPGIKLSERVTIWKASDIDALVRQMQDGPTGKGHSRIKYPSLDDITRDTITTEEAAYYLSRRPQTLRSWASFENGPIRPVRVNGRLAWRVADIKDALVGPAPVSPTPAPGWGRARARGESL
jgi:predicted DNA-binding transcriptional regulator AlpA